MWAILSTWLLVSCKARDFKNVTEKKLSGLLDFMSQVPERIATSPAQRLGQALTSQWRSSIFDLEGNAADPM